MSIDFSPEYESELTPMLEECYKRNYQDFLNTCVGNGHGNQASFSLRVIMDLVKELDAQRPGFEQLYHKFRYGEGSFFNNRNPWFPPNFSPTNFQSDLNVVFRAWCMEYPSFEWILQQQARLNVYMKAAIHKSASIQHPSQQKENSGMVTVFAVSAAILLIIVLFLALKPR